MIESNAAWAKKLRALATKVEGDESLPRPSVECSFYIYSKEEAQEILRGFGGKWTKDVVGDGEYANYILTSADFSLRIVLPRDRVCKKTVTWDCEPLLSPEDEAELVELAEVAEGGK